MAFNSGMPTKTKVMENNENTASVPQNTAANGNNGESKKLGLKERFVRFWFYKDKHVRYWRALLFGAIIISTCAIIFPYSLRYVTHLKIISEMGPYGDVYGGLNTFFTGLAFVGLIITIALQHQEMRETRKEFEEQTNLMLRQNVNACMFEQLKYMQNQKEKWENSEPDARNKVYDYLQKINEFCLRVQNQDEPLVRDEDVMIINELRAEINGTSSWSVIFRLWGERITRVISGGKNVREDRKEFVQSFWELVGGEDKILTLLRFIMYNEHSPIHSDEVPICFKESLYVANFIALHGYNVKRFSLFYHIFSHYPSQNQHTVNLTKSEITLICKQYKNSMLKDVDIISLPI